MLRCLIAALFLFSAGAAADQRRRALAFHDELPEGP
jgi:hypothetical protein